MYQSFILQVVNERPGDVTEHTGIELDYTKYTMDPLKLAKTCAYAWAIGMLPMNEEGCRRYVRLTGKWDGKVYAAFHAGTGDDVREFYASA